MLSLAPRRTLLPAALLSLGLALTGCGNDPGDNAPDPAEALPTTVASAVTGSDVGQFLATPKEGTPQADIDETVAKLKSMPGVQTAEFKDGQVSLEFRPSVTKEQRDEAVRQLAALGEVTEGI